MPKISKETQESLQRLNDQLVLAKEKGNTTLFKNIEKVIKRVKSGSGKQK